jgi:hypothetical protein
MEIEKQKRRKWKEEEEEKEKEYLELEEEDCTQYFTYEEIIKIRENAEKSAIE